MITQIEIDGFKTFKDFKVELAPFQVIVGPNGSGKSNLFDALQLLSRLADKDLYEAFQGIRGNAGEIFTKYSDGSMSDTIRIAVEMLADRKGRLVKGIEEEPSHIRLRYELEIGIQRNVDALDKLYLKSEALKTIPPNLDNWCKRYQVVLDRNSSQEEITLYSFTNENINDLKERILEIASKYAEERIEKQMKLLNVFISLREENKLEEVEEIIVEQSRIRTMVLSIAAIHDELRSLSFFHLHPAALRQHSSTNDPPFLTPEGGNLPATMARIKKEDDFAFRSISHDMTSLVPDTRRVDVEKYEAISEYRIWLQTSDRRTFSVQALSDGTLRLLALATLRNDPQRHGTICIEEPENGVEPLYLHKFAALLSEMATDFTDPDRADEPLRQVIVTTHSPLFISQPEIIDHLLFAGTPTNVSPKTRLSLRVTRMVPVMTPNTLAQNVWPAEIDGALAHYTIEMVKKYLDGDVFEEASNVLEQARSDLSKQK